MIGVVLAHIFDAKVVNDEKKNDVFGGVFPKIRSERDGGAYPNLERCRWRRSFEMRLVCFRPGIPLQISI